MATKSDGMSLRAYAAHSGLSLGGVQKAMKSGRLVTNADGSIDAAASDKRRAAMTDPAMQRGERMQAVPAEAVADVEDTLGLPAKSASGSMTFLQARAANEVLKAQERKIRLRKLKGELVDRERATALFFALSRQDRDAWLAWPPRIAATMAAELGVDAHALQAHLDRHVREHLSGLSAVTPEFR